MTCRSHTDSPVIWVNKVGTFGISSAAYWWTRLFALVGRLATTVLQRKPSIQLAYVDDLRLVSWGEGKFMWLWMLLPTYEVLGAPCSYKKFKGGLVVQFVGRAGLLRSLGWHLRDTGVLAAWLHRFNEGGQFRRLGFIARVLIWLNSPLHLVFGLEQVLCRNCAENGKARVAVP